MAATLKASESVPEVCVTLIHISILRGDHSAEFVWMLQKKKSKQSFLFRPTTFISLSSHDFVPVGKIAQIELEWDFQSFRIKKKFL